MWSNRDGTFIAEEENDSSNVHLLGCVFFVKATVNPKEVGVQEVA